MASPPPYHVIMEEKCIEDIKQTADDLCTKIRKIQTKLILDIEKRKNNYPNVECGASNRILTGINVGYDHDGDSATSEEFIGIPTFVRGKHSIEELEKIFGHIEEKPRISSFENNMQVVSKFKCNLEEKSKISSFENNMEHVSKFKYNLEEKSNVSSIESNMEVVSKFKCNQDGGNVDIIIPVALNKVWISCSKNPKNVYKADERGLVISSSRTLPFACESLGYNGMNGNFYLSNFKSKCITVLKMNGKKSKLIDTSPQYPLGLHVKLKTDTLTVCLTDKWDFENSNLGNREIIQYYTNGFVCKRVQNSTTKNLFTMPYKVSVSDNGDICVLDLTGPQKGRVVILDRGGYKQGMYFGCDKTKTFTPLDIFCRNSHEVLVSDLGSKSVHMISMTASVLEVFLADTLFNGIPVSVCVTSDKNIWIGNDSGEIYVFKYKTSDNHTNRK